ncbi:MAG: GDSL-type esterase/lipase family protein [Acutalibacteraceae bacterium]|jgi:lysophospholipase L1-like esterase
MNTIRKWAALAISAALLLTTGLLPVAAQPQETEKLRDFRDRDLVKIACVGASTTEGTGGYAYPAFLQTMAGGRVEVRNFGYSGSAVMKDKPLCYFDSDKHKACLAYQADIVIVEIGGNDAKVDFWNGGNNTFAEDYDALVQSFREQGNDPLILISLGNRAVKDSFGIKDDIVANGVVPVQKATAEKYGYPTAPLREHFIGHEDEYIIDDGIHYTAAGYEEMARLFYETLLTVVDFPEDSGEYLWRPTNLVMTDPYGEFDGYTVLQWQGKPGYFQYASGSLATALGLENGTVVPRLTVDVSYYWDVHGSRNDCLHFNTNDKDGLSAPGIANGKEHDNGYGAFFQYGMESGKWSRLTVSRDQQMLGAPGAADWWFNVGAIDAANGFYINGYIITAALDDGTVRSVYWGANKPADRKALNAAITTANGVLAADTPVFTAQSLQALSEKQIAAVAVNGAVDPAQAALDEAAEALTRALDDLRYVTGDVNGNGQVAADDALMALQAATGKIALSPIEQAAADTNQNGGVGADDALAILQKATGKIESF